MQDTNKYSFLIGALEVVLKTYKERGIHFKSIVDTSGSKEIKRFLQTDVASTNNHQLVIFTDLQTKRLIEFLKNQG